jgi:hypothetical protein
MIRPPFIQCGARIPQIPKKIKGICRILFYRLNKIGKHCRDEMFIEKMGETMAYLVRIW